MVRMMHSIWCRIRKCKILICMLITIIDSDTNTNRPTTPKPAAGSQSSTAKSSFSTSSASGDITASSSSTGNTELIGILHAFIFVSKQIMGSCFSSFTFKGFKGPVHSPTQAFNENGAQTSLSSGLQFMIISLHATNQN